MATIPIYRYNQQIPASPLGGISAWLLWALFQKSVRVSSQSGNDSLPQFPDETHYPDLTMDMGASLGYSQSIQYHSISIAQPSQEMPRLRQTRLQQLREDRMRRQQRRLSPDATALSRRKEGILPESGGVLPPSASKFLPVCLVHFPWTRPLRCVVRLHRYPRPRVLSGACNQVSGDGALCSLVALRRCPIAVCR